MKGESFSLWFQDPFLNTVAQARCLRLDWSKIYLFQKAASLRKKHQSGPYLEKRCVRKTLTDSLAKGLIPSVVQISILKGWTRWA